MRVFVKTGNKELKFRVQGKFVDFEKAIPVTMDHNVVAKIGDGSLIQVKHPATETKKKQHIINNK